MADPAGESNGQVLRLDFDRRLMLQFRGSVVTSDAGLLAHRELDDALGLTTVADEMLADARTGRNGRHAFVELFRQSVFDQAACHIDPAIGADHARDPDTILVFASSGAAEGKSWTFARRIGRFGFAGVLRWPIILGFRGRRREHCRTEAGHGDTCHGIFKSLSSEVVRLDHGFFLPGTSEGATGMATIGASKRNQYGPTRRSYGLP